jgi:hypothetical protein
VQRIAQHARELLAAVAGGGQRAARLVGGGVDQRQHQLVAVEAGDLWRPSASAGDCQKAAVAAADVDRGPLQQPGLPQDDDPAGHGHAQQEQRHQAG